MPAINDDVLSLEVRRNVSLCYRKEDQRLPWSGKMSWVATEADREAYDSDPLDLADIRHVLQRVGSKIRKHGVFSLPDGWKKFEAGLTVAMLPDALAAAEELAYRIYEGMKEHEGEDVPLHRAYGDLHIACDWMNRHLYGIA